MDVFLRGQGAVYIIVCWDIVPRYSKNAVLEKRVNEKKRKQENFIKPMSV